jgi:hypothetical protein
MENPDKPKVLQFQSDTIKIMRGRKLIKEHKKKSKTAAKT